MTQIPPSGIPDNLRRNLPLDYRPEVLKWFKVYSGAMALLYLFVILLAAFLMLAGGASGEMDATDMIVIAVILGGMGFVFFAMYAIALFLPPKPWVWIYDLVLIGIGLTSCLTLIAAIPLLIHWIKPETKAYFGRV